MVGLILARVSDESQPKSGAWASPHPLAQTVVYEWAVYQRLDTNPDCVPVIRPEFNAMETVS